MTMTNAAPQLEAPGAGISAIEMWVLNNLIKPVMIRNNGASQAVDRLKSSAADIERVLNRIKPDDLCERALVERPWFVEDSSRNWSAALLCRHLAIVDNALAGAIEKGLSLKTELLPNPSARVAAVKPEDQRNDLQAIVDFRQAVERLASAAAQHPEAELARRTIPHPWLGEISHLQWIRFAAIHHRVHLSHLRKIAGSLNSGERRP